MKFCNNCGISETLEPFQPQRRLCIPCFKQYQNTRVAKRRALNPQKHRDAVRNSKYSITTNYYNELLKQQDNKCAICLEEFTNKTKYHKPWVDHNHECCSEGGSCGKCIRGLLCANCNRFLGHIKDSPKIAERMADYLRNNEYTRKISRK